MEISQVNLNLSNLYPNKREYVCLIARNLNLARRDGSARGGDPEGEWDMAEGYLDLARIGDLKGRRELAAK